MNNRLFVVAAALVPLLIAAGDTTPPAVKSPAALAAMKQFDATTTKARNDYNRVVGAAATKLFGELDAAEKAAVRAGSLDDALAIRTLKKDTQSQLSQSQEGAAPPSNLAKELIDTKWKYSGGGAIVHYAAGGLVDGDGYPNGRWTVADANSIIQQEANREDFRIHITFTADRKACIWVYVTPSGVINRIETATFIPPDPKRGK